MTTKRVLSRLAKLKLKVKVDRGHNGIYLVKHQGQVLSFYDQDGITSALHIKREDDRSDISTDYFPGHFVRTLSGALSLMGLE